MFMSVTGLWKRACAVYKCIKWVISCLFMNGRNSQGTAVGFLARSFEWPLKYNKPFHKGEGHNHLWV